MDPKTLFWIAVLVAWHPDGTPFEGSGIYPFLREIDCKKKWTAFAARAAIKIEPCGRIRLDRYKLILKSGIIFEDDN